MTYLEQFILARWAYSLGKPVISDAEYTVLLDYMKAEMPDNEYVLRSWSDDPCPTELLKRVGREDLIAEVILADKTESMPSLNSWPEIYSAFNSAFTNRTATLSYKHDGWNIQASYYNGNLVSVNTRGRSSDAMDVSILSKLYPQTIPEKGKIKIIAECTVSKSLFSYMKTTYGNVLARSAVRTALIHPECLEKLSIHAFDIMGYTTDNVFATLQEWGFKTPEYRIVGDYKDLESNIYALSSLEEKYDFPTDGLVIAFGNDRTALRVCTWEEAIYKSYVAGYEESYGPYQISMKIKIYPVHTNKGIQQRIPITNLARIVNNNLRIGYPIAFNIISGAIADFDENTTRLLHSQYADRFDEYRQSIERSEKMYDYMANS